jgi:hypothetical protein
VGDSGWAGNSTSCDGNGDCPGSKSPCSPLGYSCGVGLNKEKTGFGQNGIREAGKISGLCRAASGSLAAFKACRCSHCNGASSVGVLVMLYRNLGFREFLGFCF